MSLRVVAYVMACLCALLSSCNRREDSASYVSIKQLKTNYKGYPTRVALDVYVSGRVVANDRYGNFYHCIVVDDGTAGIVVCVDSDVLYRRFTLGCRVRIYCESLWLDAFGQTVVLGCAASQGQTSVGDIPVELITLCADRASEVEPLSVGISEMSFDCVSRLVSVTSVRFADSEVGQQFNDEASQRTVRHVVSAEGDTLRIGLSSYADFGQTKIPSGTGRIDGILYGDSRGYELRPRSNYDIIF